MLPVCKMADNGRLTVDQKVKVVPRPFWRLVSKIWDECKSSFVRGCEAKRWSHWTCSSLGKILQPMRINSVPDVKCFCKIKMCYNYNQWYDISCPTLYIALHLCRLCYYRWWSSEFYYLIIADHVFIYYSLIYSSLCTICVYITYHFAILYQKRHIEPKDT